MAFGYIVHVNGSGSRQDIVDVGVTSGSSAGYIAFDFFNSNTTTVRTITVEIDQDDSGSYTEIDEFDLLPRRRHRIVLALDADDTVAAKQDTGTDCEFDAYQLT